MMTPMQIPGFMPMQAKRPDNSQQLMQGLLKTALARGAAPTPGAPAQGATLPGGAMNLVPQPNPLQMGLLSRLFRGALPAQPGAPMAEPTTSETAIY